MIQLPPELWRNLYWALLLAVGTAAVVEDLRSRTISNWTTLSAMLLGLGFHFASGGWAALGSALGGLLVGFFAFFVFYLLGGMGGGDIKLMAGFGAIVGGATKMVTVSIVVAMLGGLFALGALALHTLRTRRLQAAWAESLPRAGEALAGQTNPPAVPPLKLSIPYAPAITAGVWLTQWAKV